jgi:hypothetical protein
MVDNGGDQQQHTLNNCHLSPTHSPSYVIF